MASARCAHCGATLEPNTMYCLGCGQLILPGAARDEAATGWAPPPRPPRPAAPAAHVSAPVPVAKGWPDRVQLTFSTGQRIAVAGAAVIGRKPEQTAVNMGAQAIEVADDTRSMSRVHLFLDLGDGELRVGDAGSSNGSAIERGGRRIPLPGTGERVTVLRGDVLWVGDVRVEAAPL
ncbi:FHA domain-containing protein [Microbacterium rhizophilus]|uniref:FHA domain-containing protein n=1 Tax=Microbacterium rhizophilus TaxID=3138934 RepID=UPI0031EC1C17